MHIIRGINHIAPYHAGCVATIGNFDGLHLGHQQVFAHLKEKAKAYQLPATVISFEPLPHEFFSGETPPPRIYPQRDKMRLLKKLGIDDFIRLTFNKEFSQIEAADFVNHILLDKLNVRYLAVGDDFRFGKMRKGDFQLLQQIGKQRGMEVQDTATFKADGERISSTRIRQALQAGNIAEANRLLGYPYSLSGRIRHGDKLGRTIGFPTLNLKIPDNIALRSGIYAVKIEGLDDAIHYGAASVGRRPTVNGEDMRLETYVFDFNKEVYGKYICIEPVKFIRPEEKFHSIELMQAAIQQDCEQIKTLFANNGQS